MVLGFWIGNTCAQVDIKGKIVDKETNEPLPGANILVKGTNIGTISQLDGKFELTLPHRDSSVEVSYIGYQTQLFEPPFESFLEIQLITGEGLTICKVVPTITDSPIDLTLPVPFMKISKSNLKRDDEVAITPALNRVPGVYMHSGALNTNRITMRGIGNRSPFSTTKIRAYLDDIPLTSGDGETTIEDIDLSIIEEVKVWKGPTASIYGAGLGGMIHLKTTDNSEFEDSFLNSKMTIGSYGLIRNASNFNYLNDEGNFNLKLNYNNTHSDGYRQNNEYDRESFSVLGKIISDENNETTIFGNFTHVKAFIPSSLNREDYENEPQKAAFTWGRVRGFEDYDKIIIGISHKSRLVQIGDFALKNRSSIFTNLRNAYESRPFNILDESSQSYGFRTSFDLDKADNEMTPFPMFSIGIESFREDYKWQTFETNEGTLGESLSNNQEERTYYNFFTQFHQKLTEELTLLAGVNLNHTLYQYEDRFAADSIDLSGDYSFDWVLSPRIGLNYQFDYKISLFANVSHGFSPPSFSETLTPDGNINPNIQPEKGWNFELGSRGKLSPTLQYELTFYNMVVKDLLVAKRIGPDQFSGVNAGKTRHTGLEFYLGSLLYWNRNELTPFVTYTYSNYEFIDFVDDENDYSGNELTGTPPHNLNLGFDYRHFSGFFGNLNYQFVDAFPMRDDNSIYSESYSVLNLKLGYKKVLWYDWEIEIFGGIRNVLDEKYASMILINAGSFGGNAPRYYYPGLPRNFFGGVSLKYLLN
jgi:iron complex outermembrane receptor protein